MPYDVTAQLLIKTTGQEQEAISLQSRRGGKGEKEWLFTH